MADAEKPNHKRASHANTEARIPPKRMAKRARLDGPHPVVALVSHMPGTEGREVYKITFAEDADRGLILGFIDACRKIAKVDDSASHLLASLVSYLNEASLMGHFDDELDEFLPGLCNLIDALPYECVHTCIEDASAPLGDVIQFAFHWSPVLEC